MSVSTWCLNSVSEINIPATNAPKAKDSPACSVIHDKPRVMSKRLSMNSSSLLRCATCLSHQRMSFCPPVSNKAIKAVALSKAKPNAAANFSGGDPKAGISTSRGTTAKS